MEARPKSADRLETLRRVYVEPYAPRAEDGHMLRPPLALPKDPMLPMSHAHGLFLQGAQRASSSHPESPPAEHGSMRSHTRLPRPSGADQKLQALWTPDLDAPKTSLWGRTSTDFGSFYAAKLLRRQLSPDGRAATARAAPSRTEETPVRRVVSARSHSSPRSSRTSRSPSRREGSPRAGSPRAASRSGSPRAGSPRSARRASPSPRRPPLPSQRDVAEGVQRSLYSQRSFSAPAFRFGCLRSEDLFDVYRNGRFALPRPDRTRPYHAINDARVAARNAMLAAEGASGSEPAAAVPPRPKVEPYPERWTTKINGPLEGYAGHRAAWRVREGEENLPISVRVERRLRESASPDFIEAQRMPPPEHSKLGFWTSRVRYGWPHWPPRGLDQSIADLATPYGYVTRTAKDPDDPDADYDARSHDSSQPRATGEGVTERSIPTARAGSRSARSRSASPRRKGKESLVLKRDARGLYWAEA